jgi:hypothetical protein
MTTPTDEFPRETSGLPATSATATVELADGDRFALRIAPVSKRIGDATVRMLAYNGSIPGPTMRVAQGSRLLVDVENQGDMEATVHWHGLRLENRFDGTHETQEAIPVGGRYSARVAFPDPGVYWYHPQIREDYNQEMGCTATSSSSHPTPTTGRRSTLSSRSRWTTCSSRTAGLPRSAPTRRPTPRWGASATSCSSPGSPSSR